MRESKDTIGARGVGYVSGALGLSSSAFTLLRDLIGQRLGHYFEDAKLDVLADKISEIVAAHDVSSVLDYYYLLKYDADSEHHWNELADRLAVPETFFWRQPEQILALTDVLAARHAAEHPNQPLRIWSAACCSGEEPLSIAIALAERGWLERLDVQVVGSDASSRLLERARSGTFGERSFRNIPPELRRRYFTYDQGRWRVSRALHQIVKFERINLMDPLQVAPLAAADVIFCRNVFIYFSDDAVRSVARTFARHMPDTGTLFLGAPESLVRLGTEFKLVEIGKAFAYQKTNGGDPRLPSDGARTSG